MLARALALWRSGVLVRRYAGTLAGAFVRWCVDACTLARARTRIGRIGQELTSAADWRCSQEAAFKRGSHMARSCPECGTRACLTRYSFQKLPVHGTNSGLDTVELVPISLRRDVFPGHVKRHACRIVFNPEFVPRSACFWNEFRVRHGSTSLSDRDAIQVSSAPHEKPLIRAKKRRRAPRTGGFSCAEGALSVPLQVFPQLTAHGGMRRCAMPHENPRICGAITLLAPRIRGFLMWEGCSKGPFEAALYA